MKRFIIATAAAITAVVIVASQIVEVRLYAVDNRAAIALCVTILVATLCVTIGSRAGLAAAPWEAPEPCSRF